MNRTLGSLILAAGFSLTAGGAYAQSALPPGVCYGAYATVLGHQKEANRNLQNSGAVVLLTDAQGTHVFLWTGAAGYANPIPTAQTVGQYESRGLAAIGTEGGATTVSYPAKAVGKTIQGEVSKTPGANTWYLSMGPDKDHRATGTLACSAAPADVANGLTKKTTG